MQISAHPLRVLMYANHRAENGEVDAAGRAGRRAPSAPRRTKLPRQRRRENQSGARSRQQVLRCAPARARSVYQSNYHQCPHHRESLTPSHNAKANASATTASRRRLAWPKSCWPPFPDQPSRSARRLSVRISRASNSGIQPVEGQAARHWRRVRRLRTGPSAICYARFIQRRIFGSAAASSATGAISAEYPARRCRA